MPFSTLVRPVLLAAARSSRIERTVTRVPVTKKVVDRFVAGDNENDAVRAAAAILSSGRDITVDFLGEDTGEPAQATATVEHYLTLLSALAQLPLPRTGVSTRSVEVSVKLTALGLCLPEDGPRIALENARKICSAATEVGARVTIDAEDHSTADSRLDIVRALRENFPTVGTVLQAYLKRTEQDCRDLAGPGSRIRLCKGAYDEPASVAYRGAQSVDENYLVCLRILMSGRGYPMVATHDPVMISAAQRLAVGENRSSNDFEFQMLYGIRDAEQTRLAEEGHRVRVYVPYGTEWYGYFMRRLAERPANLAFFSRSLISNR
ncbi:proline dehydrogenase family protein [Rhodococcus sp. BP-252]|uniref:proline dehydrogenase family protein n=1 Tax=unclassified Rhodococcus (in: high G+C Gram-positive bacteria) TaxID=192944 RepID=UPI00142F5762|nr:MULTISPECIES: proline dehydrogenase family protein [unclassified Rhodococcus (in: high G+C Gram-positive bacteria)]MBY6410243.1 proline dehydrogenase family protein [Rhodococcus sp. BP-320]MBY6415212.1 proline dehydrogenase family protein [Rhodococcus sp. BP-321]MBY6424220.1 proline dehydrogenase family protein [Rhodococcus sp. BP-324]MBY6429360.1 proline dehydrogenase family protein [Rhodococcus sp. BP-323]MBY6430108.1 proline dehydrogenase family protein [Rhodococcus sp. BP-322]